MEKTNINFAKKEFGFDFSLVFYDVTTLYFESFTSDKFRKNGFSKDNKSNQPQILIGLMVNKEGFPVVYDIFPGNTFEGHTIIPTILRIKKKYDIENLTVVADVAMISLENILKLRSAGINFIVGARLANLQNKLILEIDKKLQRVDSANIRIETSLGFLICNFSKKRFNKDKHEMNKQILKANELLGHPGKAKKIKYIKST